MDYSWNPTHGCSPIAVGCQHCWAKGMAKRLAAMGAKGYDKSDPFKVVCDGPKLDEPLQVRKPSRIGVTFMGDLFHEDVPFEFIDHVFAAMALSPQHMFLVLTKRVKKMVKYTTTQHNLWHGFPYFVGPTISTADDVHRWCDKQGVTWKERERRIGIITDGGGFHFDQPDLGSSGWPLPNVHLGISCSTQADLDANLPELLRCPAAVRWLSLEPLIEAVDLEIPHGLLPEGGMSCNRGDDHRAGECDCEDGLDWIVVGCESGPGRRPCKNASYDNEWSESAVDQCVQAGVPVYVKQIEIKGRVSTDPNEWPEWAQRQELPTWPQIGQVT